MHVASSYVRSSSYIASYVVLCTLRTLAMLCATLACDAHIGIGARLPAAILARLSLAWCAPLFSMLQLSWRDYYSYHYHTSYSCIMIPDTPATIVTMPRYDTADTAC